MNGFLYSCGGSPTFLNRAIGSARSVKKRHPEAKICLFHLYDPNVLEDFDLSVFDLVREPELPDPLPEGFTSSMRFFLAKLIAISQTPFSRTLFLDCDTLIQRNISSLFSLLDRFDLALAPGPVPQKPLSTDDPLSEVPDSFPELNTGVMLYRDSDAVRRLLAEWIAVFSDVHSGLFRKHREGGDQVALRYLLWKHPEIALHVLSTPGVPNLFNFRWPRGKSFHFDEMIRIWHHHTVSADQEGAPESEAAPTAGSFAQPPALATSTGASPAVDIHPEFHRYGREKGSDFFFIQIGANDGRSWDPVHTKVENFGWQGILIEPVPHLFEELVARYAGFPGLKFERIAIATEDGERDFYYFPPETERAETFPEWGKGMGSLLEPFDSPGHQRIRDLGFSMETLKIDCLTFRSLLKRHDVKRIELLQIDAEGFDGEILMNAGLTECRPTFIQYEDRHLDRLHQAGAILHSSRDVQRYLEEAGYLVAPVRNGFDRLCVDREFWKHRSSQSS